MTDFCRKGGRSNESPSDPTSTRSRPGRLAKLLRRLALSRTLTYCKTAWAGEVRVLQTVLESVVAHREVVK